ncbi:PepSY domain-containing protein [Neobacillus sp. PS3-12]|jgi:predicted small secreted protein|uniref:PepSY domain-containing protein n=1 Tax=Neobacillus sp. PS3-12 TaxID=3070677 RepID=UPI0027E0AACF|nr:PepSY domain-containing protein [Neobacillus sp. PS3-12]WML54370.1 PepSY domain-containing protein [Neobacillus sp. PS3-12]
MNWKPFMIGTAVGLIGGYAAKEMISKKVNRSAEKVLDDVKNQFKQHGNISGSWIHMEAELYEKEQISYKVYKGGVSKHENGEQKQFEFIADASTGTIIDIYPINDRK